MTKLSREEKQRFKNYLAEKITAIEGDLKSPTIDGGHQSFSDQATRNAYMKNALNEVRIAFDIDIHSTEKDTYE